MTFLAPLGLLSLLALPIIIVLHLLGSRRRRLVVPSLLLWQGVPVRPEGFRWQRLPITPLLLLHLLAAMLLGLALAQPQLTGILNDGQQHTAMLIDTSTSMATREGSWTRLDQARDQARARISAMRPGDYLSLYAIGPQTRVIAEGGAGDAALLNAALDRLQAGGTGTNLDQALAIAEASLRPAYRRQIVVFSDSAIAEPTLRSLGVPIEWVQTGTEQPNRAIVTFATRPWQGKLQLYARIANYGGPAFPTTLSLYDGATLISRDVVPLRADGEYELTWSLPAGTGNLRAELDGGDSLPADDQAFLSVRPARESKVVFVTADPATLLRALVAVPGVRVTTIDPSTYSIEQSANAALTIYDSFLPAAWPASPVLVINPPGGEALLPVEDTPRMVESNRLISRGSLLEGLSFSGVRFVEAQALVPPDWAMTLLASSNPDGNEVPLILRGQPERFPIAIWTFSLHGGNLPARLAFPLLVSRTVRDLTAGSPPAAITVGASVPFRPDPHTTQIRLVAPDQHTRTFAPGAAQVLEQLQLPGFYQIEERHGNDLLYTAGIGVNAGSPLESRISPSFLPQFDAPEQDRGARGPLREPVDLWPWFAVAGLLVLAAEWLFVLWQGRRGPPLRAGRLAR